MNKRSKLMARTVAAMRNKTKMPFLMSQITGSKLVHPQEIANEFSDFYHRLYNLNEDLLY